MEDSIETLNLVDPLEAVTESTITSVGELRAELERVRSEGAAFTIGELEDGFNGVAVPGFDVPGRCSVVLSACRSGELRAELERVRSEGAAFTIGELEDGFNGVAVPVFDVSGRCSVVLSVSGPEHRLPPERLPAVAARSKGAARA